MVVFFRYPVMVELWGVWGYGGPGTPGSGPYGGCLFARKVLSKLVSVFILLLRTIKKAAICGLGLNT